jgi:hypothetical protein
MVSSSRWVSSNGRFVGSARRPPAEVRRRTDAQGQRVGALGLSRRLQRPPNEAPRRRTGGRFRARAPARARAAVAAVQVADFPRRPVRSARSRPCPLLCGYGDAGASLVGWHFVLVGPDLTITGPEQVVNPGAVLARSGQGSGPIRPTSSAYRSLATSCTKPRPQTRLRGPRQRRAIRCTLLVDTSGSDDWVRLRRTPSRTTSNLSRTPVNRGQGRPTGYPQEMPSPQECWT